MDNDKCGIYQIRCVVSGKSYVGSSKRIYSRWSQHRTRLRKGDHPSPRLQSAWNKHGEGKFVFSILEECAQERLYEREQHHIDAERRDYNSMPKVTVVTKEMRRKMVASLRARAALITHCPRGHEYSEANTYRNKRGKRICRECNALRVSATYTRETPEQRESRLQRVRQYFERTREERERQMLEYRKLNRDKKAAYDRAHLAEKRARRARYKLTEQRT